MTALLEQYLERLPRSFAGQLAGVVECELLGAGPSERFQLELGAGTCTLHRDAYRTPSVTVSLTAADLGRLLEGEVGVGELFLRQRLTVSGDVMLASRLPALLGLPQQQPRVAA